MDDQNVVAIQNNSKSYFKKIIVFSVAILVLIALVFLSDFVGNGSKQSGTATLSWEANTESDLAGYKIYYGTSPRTGDCPSGGYSERVDVKKTATPEKPSFVVEDLDMSKAYYFSITSYDASGNESCFQKEVSKSFPVLE